MPDPTPSPPINLSETKYTIIGVGLTVESIGYTISNYPAATA